MKNSVEVSENAMKKLVGILKKNDEKIREMDEKMNEMSEFYDVLHLTSTMLENHQNDMMKLESFFNGHIKDNFFRIIDIFRVEEKLNILNASLSDQYILPQLSAYDMIYLAKIYTTTNETHITLIIRIPILNVEPYAFKEFIPIPMVQNNKTFILDTNSSYFIQDSFDKVKMIAKDTLEDCFSFSRIMICNSLLKDSFLEPDNCVRGLLENNTDNYCGQKTVAEKNYFVKISSTALFVHVTNPLKFKIICGLEERFINVSISELINFSQFCELFEYSHHHINGSLVFSSEVYTPTFQPIIRIFNSTESKWSSNFEILAKDDIKYIEILNKTKPLFEYIDKKIEDIKKEAEKPNSWFSFITVPFDSLMSFISEKLGTIPQMMIHFTLCYVLLPLFLFFISYKLILLTVKKLICRSSL